MDKCYRCNQLAVVRVRVNSCLECFERLIWGQFKSQTTSLDWAQDDVVIAYDGSQSCCLLLFLALQEREAARCKAGVRQWSHEPQPRPDRGDYVRAFQLSSKLSVVTVLVGATETPTPPDNIELRVEHVDVDVDLWKALDPESKRVLRSILVSRHLSQIPGHILLGFNNDSLTNRALSDLVQGGGAHVALAHGLRWGPKTFTVPLRGVSRDEVQEFVNRKLPSWPRKEKTETETASLGGFVERYVSETLSSGAVHAVINALSRCEARATTERCELCWRYREGAWSLPKPKEKAKLMEAMEVLCGQCALLATRNDESAKFAAYCGGVCKLIDVAPGDYIQALAMDAGGVFVGTTFGRVIGALFQTCPPLARTPKCWAADRLDLQLASASGEGHLLHNAAHRNEETGEKPGHPQTLQKGSPLLCPPPAFRHMLYAAHSDSSVRQIHTTDSEVITVVGNQSLRAYGRYGPKMQKGFDFDRRVTCNLEYVLGRPGSGVVLVGSDGICVFVDLVEQKQYMCSMRIQSKDFVPCDFNGKEVLVFSHFGGKDRQLEVLGVPMCKEEPRWSDVPQLLFQLKIGKHQNQCHLFKFWGDDCVVFIENSCKLSVHNYHTGVELWSRKVPFGSDVLAIDSGDSEVLFTLSADATMALWSRDGLLTHFSLSPLTFRCTLNVMVTHIDVHHDRLYFDAMEAQMAMSASLREWVFTEGPRGEFGPPGPSLRQAYEDKIFAVAADYGVYMFSLRRMLRP